MGSSFLHRRVYIFSLFTGIAHCKTDKCYVKRDMIITMQHCKYRTMTSSVCRSDCMKSTGD